MMPSPTPQNVATKVESEQAALSSNSAESATGSFDEAVAPTPKIEETQGVTQSSNYIIFGVLVVVLASGLVFLRLR
jgi:hypothetical protein